MTPYPWSKKSAQCYANVKVCKILWAGVVETGPTESFTATPVVIKIPIILINIIWKNLGLRKTGKSLVIL